MGLIDVTKVCEELLDEPEQYFYHKTFQRHLDDLNRLDPSEYRFNTKLASVYVLVMGSFKHFKGSEFAGQNFKMEKWQIAIVAIAMGWEKVNTKGEWVRRFNTLNFFMARKNGKTFISAGLSIADMMIRKEPQGEIVWGATKRDQAKIGWDGSHSLIKAHPDLKKKFRKVMSTLTFTPDGTTIKTLGRDGGSEDGANVSIGVLDELHAHPTSAIYDVVKSSMGARKQPLLIIISTAGFNLGSPLIPEVEHARDILNGIIEDESYFAFICEPDLNNQDPQYPFTEEAWKASNPNYGVSVSKDYIQGEAETARNRPDKLVNYLTKHLNMFVNSSQVYLPSADWKACSTEVKGIPDLSEATRMFIGTDLSVVDDWTSVSTTYLFPNNSLYTETKLFIPEDTTEDRARHLRIPLETWIAQEYVTCTHGATINQLEVYNYITSQIDKADELDIDVIHAYDPYKAKWIIAKLENDLGFEENIPVYQGYKTMTEPLTMLLTYVRTGQFTHLHNPALNWMSSNLEISYDSYGNMKPDKSNPIKKIDGIASMINTFCVSIPYIEEDTEDGGVIWL